LERGIFSKTKKPDIFSTPLKISPQIVSPPPPPYFLFHPTRGGWIAGQGFEKPWLLQKSFDNFRVFSHPNLRGLAGGPGFVWGPNKPGYGFSPKGGREKRAGGGTQKGWGRGRSEPNPKSSLHRWWRLQMIILSCVLLSVSRHASNTITHSWAVFSSLWDNKIKKRGPPRPPLHQQLFDVQEGRGPFI